MFGQLLSNNASVKPPSITICDVTLKGNVLAYCQQISSVNNVNSVNYSLIQAGPYDVNSTATVSCNAKYYPVPKDGVKCISSGYWEKTLQCLCESQLAISERIVNYNLSLITATCEQLPDPTNGHVFISDGIANPGANATFTCDLPHYITELSVLVCKQDCNWNGASPTCESKSDD